MNPALCFPALILTAASLACALDGAVIPATNPGLPHSYQFQEYRYPQPGDSATCRGVINAGAVIERVFLAQTHVMEPEWPLFFLIADRPALLMVVVTGSGLSPDVSVTGMLDDEPLGQICLRGPETLPGSVDATQPRLDDRFSVTLPRAWMQHGLSLEIRAGNAVRSYTSGQLGIGPQPEHNLVRVDFDILDYNTGKPDVAMPATFIANLAGAIPAAAVRFGTFPARMVLRELVAVTNAGEIVRIDRATSAVSGMNVLAAALRFNSALLRAAGDYAWAHYLGFPHHVSGGGWGGERSFVSIDYTDIFIHELGHTFTLPHWGEGSYGLENPGENQYRYPYGGVGNNGGGRGESWNYYQNTAEFVSPICGVSGANLGNERSDAMQRNNPCIEMRSTGRGLWDGFGDFSAFAIFRHMVGAERYAGTIPYRSNDAPFHLRRQTGFPTLRADAQGRRYFERRHQPFGPQDWEQHDFLVPHRWDTPVYLIYGTYHPEDQHANILYQPLSYIGNLPRVLDPTDPVMFEELAKGGEGPYGHYFWWEKDLTFKLTYDDGSVLHALYPYDNVSRTWQRASHPWRWDLLYFALSVPADKPLTRIELYRRPFCVRYPSTDYEGNIARPQQGITAANFMNNATLANALDVSVLPVSIAARQDIDKAHPQHHQEAAFDLRIEPGRMLLSRLHPGSTLEVFDMQGARQTRFVVPGTTATWERRGIPSGVFVVTVQTPSGERMVRRAVFAATR